METYEALLWLAGGATAITAIYKIVSAIVHCITGVYNFIHGIDANVKKLVEHDNEQYLAILRLTVVSTDLPMSERLIAGQTYIDKGGNGDVQKLFEELLHECNEG